MIRYQGISAYAGLHKRFPAARFMEQYPAGIRAPGIAFVCGCFGWNWELMELFCKRFMDVPHCVEFHISNGASRRSGRLGPGAYAEGVSVSKFNKAWEAGGNPALKKQLNNFLGRIKQALGKFGNENTKVIVCPELEDNMTDKAFNGMVQALCESGLGLWFSLARSPCTGGSGALVKYREIHGRGASLSVTEIANLDGVSVDFGDGEKYFDQISIADAIRWMKECKGVLTLLWSATQQGVGGESNFSNWPPHKKRVFKVTDKAILGMRSILRTT